MNLDFYSFIFGVVLALVVIVVLVSIVFGVSWFSTSTEEVTDYKPEYPLRWWVDDLSHRTCGLIDHPIYGIQDMPWPDNQKVYIAIDETYHNEALGWWYAEACTLSDQGKDIRKENFPALIEKMKRDLSNGRR